MYKRQVCACEWERARARIIPYVLSLRIYCLKCDSFTFYISIHTVLSISILKSHLAKMFRQDFHSTPRKNVTSCGEYGFRVWFYSNILGSSCLFFLYLRKQTFFYCYIMIEPIFMQSGVWKTLTGLIFSGSFSYLLTAWSYPTAITSTSEHFTC